MVPNIILIISSTITTLAIINMIVKFSPISEPAFSSVTHNFAFVDKSADMDLLLSSPHNLCRMRALKGSPPKKTFAFGHCPNYLSPPHPTPQLRQHIQLFFKKSANNKFSNLVIRAAPSPQSTPTTHPPFSGNARNKTFFGRCSLSSSDRTRET